MGDINHAAKLRSIAENMGFTEDDIVDAAKEIDRLTALLEESEKRREILIDSSLRRMIEQAEGVRAEHDRLTAERDRLRYQIERALSMWPINSCETARFRHVEKSLRQALKREDDQ